MCKIRILRGFFLPLLLIFYVLGKMASFDLVSEIEICFSLCHERGTKEQF